MINLPFPPTTNSLTGVHNGRKIKSKRYRTWEKAAGWRLRLSSETYPQIWAASVMPKGDGPYHLEITLVRPDKRSRDVNNYDKAISDLLVTHGITPDDHLMQSLMVRWADARDGPVIRVRAG